LHRNGARSVPLVPGLFVDVELASPQKIVGIEIPRSALRNGNQVYIYKDDTLELKPVKVVFTSEEFVIVNNNEQTALSAGEQVIVTSVPGAHDGMAVTLPELVKAELVSGEDDDQNEAEKTEPDLAQPNEQIEGESSEEQAAEQEENLTPESSQFDSDNVIDVNS